VCKYRFTRILLGAYKALRRKKGMQYRSRCIFLSHAFGNALLFRYIYKGRLVKISANIAFLFYKEIYINYLILYYKFAYCIPSTCILIGAVRRGFGGSCSGCKNNNYDTKNCTIHVWVWSNLCAWGYFSNPATPRTTFYKTWLPWSLKYDDDALFRLHYYDSRHFDFEWI
jgi:hypothetical protein